MEIKYGKKLLEELGAGLAGPVYLSVPEKWRDSVERKLSVEAEVLDLDPPMEKDGLSKLAEGMKEAGVVVAVGDDMVIEASRYLAFSSGSKFIAVPVAITSESIVRSEVVVRDKGRRVCVGEHETELLLVDYSLIWTGPEAETRAGVGTILSIVTAVEDWKLSAVAEAAEFDERPALDAMEIVTDLMDRVDDIYDLTEAGIKRLVELLVAREDFARERGSRRLIEGSEHMFADCAEAHTGRVFPRGALLCLGVVLMMELQKMNSKPVKQFLHWLNVAWKPEKLGLTEPEIAGVLGSLKDFDKANGCRYTVIREADMSGPTIKRVIEGMRAPILKSSLQDRED